MLVDTRNPLNIGAVARAMSNFGFSELRVVNPYEVAFREAKSAAGGKGVLAGAKEYESLSEAVSDCRLVVGTTAIRNREVRHSRHPLNQAAKKIRSRLKVEKVALLFGSEKFGLSTVDLSHCHWLLNIPTHDTNVSMNLGQAAALCFYELANARPRAERHLKVKRATGGQNERVTAMFFNALRTSGYVKEVTARSAEEKLRRLVRRLELSSEDAEVMQGMLRQILWKLKQD